MPDPIKLPFARPPQAVSIDRGPYSMQMEDGENAEITMYGEVVERHPNHKCHNGSCGIEHCP